MPKSRRREELAVLIGLEVLAEGVSFDSHDLRKLPFQPAHVTRVLRALMNSGVLERINSRKYLFSDRFLGVVKEEILGKTPRTGILQFPTMTIFDICGVEYWSERELEHFVRRLREHWLDLSGKQREMIKG
ncbi:MAG TPA: hypothetical protein VGR53_04260 [Nitrososphaerales archaeon]|nr:hypothetical protein [Nitrososphaerales archaeon]